MANNESSINNWKKTAVITWAIIGIFAVIWISSLILRQANVVLPLVIYTMAIVYILRPAVEKLNSKGIPRGLAVLITYLIVSAIIALLLWYLLPILFKQFVSFAEDVPTRFYPKIQQIGHNLLSTYQNRLGDTLIDSDKMVKSFSLNAQKFGTGVLAGLPGATVNFFSSMLNLVLAPILAFYFLKDLPVIRESVSELIPKKNRSEFLEIVNKTNLVLAGFLKGQLTVSLIVGFLASIWFWIIGVDFPFVLGMIAGILNIIPYLGPVIGGSLAAIVAAFNPVGAILKVILVAGGMLAIQQLDSSIISPQIMKKHVNLHPILIMFGLLIGGSIFGIFGMVLSIPVMAVGKVLLYHFIGKHDIF